MNGFTPDEKEKLFHEIALIKRGMYGDKDNDVKGLIEDMRNVKQFISQIRLKTAYISGGIATVMIGLRMFWEWVAKEHKA